MPAEIRLRLSTSGYRRVALPTTRRAPVVRSTARAAAPAPVRAVVETWPIDSEESVQRVSLSGGEALRLVRILVGSVDDLTFLERAA